jgi:hypothetical protein
MFYLTIISETKAELPWTETSETMSQNKSFLLEVVLFQLFCHSNGKVTNTPGDTGTSGPKGALL